MSKSRKNLNRAETELWAYAHAAYLDGHSVTIQNNEQKGYMEVLVTVKITPHHFRATNPSPWPNGIIDKK